MEELFRNRGSRRKNSMSSSLNSPSKSLISVGSDSNNNHDIQSSTC
jgi:hypothetical protein